MGRQARTKLLAPALIVGLAAWITIGLAGCKPDRAIRTGALVEQGVKPPAAVAAATTSSGKNTRSAGVITGVVSVHGQLPQETNFNMSHDPVCAVGGKFSQSEQYVADHGGLANVYVYVKSGPSEAMKASAALPSSPVILEQTHCRYEPHVLAIPRGGTVQFRNSDGTRHSLHIGSRFLIQRNVVLPAKGAPSRRQFEQPETMITVLCDDHPWMNAYLNVAPTPFYTVTDARGHFGLSGLPPGTYTLAAVHERLGEQTLTVQVASNSQSAAQFIYTAR